MDADEAQTENAPEPRDPQPWSWVTFWSILVGACSGWFRLCGAMIGMIERAMDEHVEYTVSRKAFAERASLEIEALTREAAPVG